MKRAALLLLAALLAPAAAGAEMQVPPGFTVQVYATGQGFDGSGVASGIPSVSSLAFDPAGALYVARSGRRYLSGGEVEDVWPIFRIPLGGGRLTRETETRFIYGPPLPNVQVGAARAPGELLVTTYDRDRGHGVLYRIADGRAELVAGGTPPRGTPPQLKQPEGVAVDASGHIYVADRQYGAVLRLDPSGRLLDPRWLVLPRPRLLVAQGDRLWVTSDGDAEAPWQRDAKGVYNAVIDQKEWAKKSAKWLADKLGGKGNITEIEGYVGHPANEARMAGVAEVLQDYPNIKVVARDTGKWDPATAQKVAANFLASVPNIDGMWTQDGMAEGELLALKAANPAKWPIVVGEARASFLRNWKKTLGEKPGFETVGVVNPPAVGAAGVRIAYNILNGKKIDPAKLGGANQNTFFVPIPDVVTNDNLDAWLKKIEGQPDSYTLDAEVNQALADGYFQK